MDDVWNHCCPFLQRVFNSLKRKPPTQTNTRVKNYKTLLSISLITSMAVEDEMFECSFSSLTLDTKSKDTNMSESNWDSCLIKTALLDTTITDQHPLLNSSVSPAKDDGYIRGKMKRTVEVAKQKYNDDVIQISDSEGDLVFPTFAVEPSSDDIFKVWDLNCSVGEGELVKQLNKAISASFIYTNERANDDSVNHLTMGVVDLSFNQGFGRLDRLTSGIADMSLDQNYGPKLPK